MKDSTELQKTYSDLRGLIDELIESDTTVLLPEAEIFSKRLRGKEVDASRLKTLLNCAIHSNALAHRDEVTYSVSHIMLGTKLDITSADGFKIDTSTKETKLKASSKSLRNQAILLIQAITDAKVIYR